MIRQRPGPNGLLQVSCPRDSRMQLATYQWLRCSERSSDAAHGARPWDAVYRKRTLAARGRLAAARPAPADAHGPLQLVRVFQHFASEVGGQLRIVGQE